MGVLRFGIAPGEMVDLIYNRTHETSPARNFAVDLFTYHAAAEHLQWIRGTAPQDLFADVSVTLVNKKGSASIEPLTSFGERPTKTCAYGSHAKNETCHLDEPIHRQVFDLISTDSSPYIFMNTRLSLIMLILIS